MWDDKSLEGDINYYTLNYFLADNTVNIKEVRKVNSGKDTFPLYVSRAKLPKKQRNNLTLSESRNMKGDNSPVADDYPQILIRSGKRKPITGQTSSTPLANDKMTFIRKNHLKLKTTSYL